MNILAVESAWWDRKRLEQLVREAMPDGSTLHVFADTKQALEYAQEIPVDVAFIDLAGMHVPGYYLAKELLSERRLNVIFTNYEWEHLHEAFELRVSGFIRKPLRYEDVVTEFQNLRYTTDAEGVVLNIAADSPSRSKPRRGLIRRISNLF